MYFGYSNGGGEVLNWDRNWKIWIVLENASGQLLWGRAVRQFHQVNVHAASIWRVLLHPIRHGAKHLPILFRQPLKFLPELHDLLSRGVVKEV